MKHITLLVLFVFGVFSTGYAQLEGLPPVPDPPRLVNDYTGTTLTGGQALALEQKLINYEDTTSTQIAVLIVRTTQPYEIADFAQRTGQSWGVGSARDNGILIVVAVQDRLAHIATGYGMEGAIPDAAAYTIITGNMRPNFRNGDYYRGIDEAVDVIISLASGEYTADELVGGGNKDFDWGILILFLLIFVIFPMWSAYRRRKYRDYGSRDVPWWIFLGGSGGGGRGTGWGDFSGGSGGFGGGGGGFGGFGGGGFGGGGATGGW